jgi:CPA2 family monovalent cation:H+ antiporter-2
LIALAPRLADTVLRLPFPQRLKSGFSTRTLAKEGGHKIRLKDHLIVVGYGLNGRNLARAARLTGIPYVIVEMNPQTVREERQKGEPIIYGDASQESVLEHLGIQDARILVIVISDPLATRRITSLARKKNPSLFILVRTRFLVEMGGLHGLGASEVIPEEFETSLEIFSRVLTRYLIPRDEIERLISQARADGYEMLRTQQRMGVSLPELKQNLPDLDISAVRLVQGSPVAGRSIGEIELRKTYGVTVLAIRRGTEIISNPGADTVLHAEDLLIILGPPARLTGACHIFCSPVPGEDGECDLPGSD